MKKVIRFLLVLYLAARAIPARAEEKNFLAFDIRMASDARFAENREPWIPRADEYLAAAALREEKQKQKKRERRWAIFFGAVIAVGVAGMYYQYKEDQKSYDGGICCGSDPYLRYPPPTVGDPNAHH